MKARDKL